MEAMIEMTLIPTKRTVNEDRAELPKLTFPVLLHRKTDDTNAMMQPSNIEKPKKERLSFKFPIRS